MTDKNEDFADRLLEQLRNPSPCLPISCPPVEEFTFTAISIRCPDCGVIPTSCHSIFVEEDHDLVWTCPTHGVIDLDRLRG